MELWQQQARDALTGMGYPLSAGIVAGGRALASAAPELRIETKDTDLFIYGVPTPKARVWLADNGAVLIEKESKYGDDFNSRNYHVGDLDLIFLYAVDEISGLFSQFDLGICCVGWLPEIDIFYIHPKAERDYDARQISVWLPITDNRIARAEKYAKRLGWPIVWPGGVDPRTLALDVDLDDTITF